MFSENAQQLAQSSPASFAHVCSAGQWVPYDHLILLNDHLLRLVEGEIDRLIVTMPPQHGKSELISHWLPAWYLGRFPERKVLLGSYQARNAHGWGRKARECLHEFGPPIWGVDVAEEPRGADWWFTSEGGYMASDGLGGAFTGKGAHLMVVDDPIKGHEEANSEVMRDKAWDWWIATLSTRLQQQSAVVLVQTRWHEDDLAGRLLLHEEDEWTVLNLPALAEEDDALDRAVGEPLCSELHDLEKLERQKRKGTYWWAAMFQQRPAPAEGFLFRREYFRTWTEDQVGAARFYVLHTDDGPKRFDQGLCTVFQTVDVAASERETADFTVIATWARTPESQLLLLDVQRQHFEIGHVVAFLERTNDAWDKCRVYVESFGHGYGPYQALRRSGRAVNELKPDTDKLRRAQHAIAAYERTDVYHPRAASWLGDYESELLSFPNATHDDQVDVVAYACRLLPGLGGQKQAQDVTRPHTITGGIMGQKF